jgi:energy-coupling factor transporter ATP-binding protein EcfA2
MLSLDSSPYALSGNGAGADTEPASVLPPPPRSLRDTGLPQQFVVELVAKALYVAGKTHLPVLTARLHLPITVLREALDFMVTEHVAEVAWRGESDIDIQYQLTAAGKQRAAGSMERCRYVGPAPVTLDAYRAMVERQALHAPPLGAEELGAEFADQLLAPRVLQMLGAAMYAGRTMLLYGPSGSGKSTLARKLGALQQGLIVVPHAVLVGQDVVQVYDPLVHLAPHGPQLRQCRLAAERRSVDARWVQCERPVVALDADVTADMLDLQADLPNGCYRAAPQLKANNGLLIVDDLGRQRIAAGELLNRFSQAQELRRSQLSLAGGYHFDAPCRMRLLFATSLAPEALLDAPSLRRVGYKIPVGPLSAASYRSLFRQQCLAFGMLYDDAALRYLVDELHAGRALPLLAAYPQELLGRIVDFAGYHGTPPRLTIDALDQAWNSMFTRDEPGLVGAEPMTQLVDQLAQRSAQSGV